MVRGLVQLAMLERAGLGEDDEIGGARDRHAGGRGQAVGAGEVGLPGVAVFVEQGVRVGGDLDGAERRPARDGAGGQATLRVSPHLGAGFAWDGTEGDRPVGEGARVVLLAFPGRRLGIVGGAFRAARPGGRGRRRRLLLSLGRRRRRGRGCRAGHERGGDRRQRRRRESRARRHHAHGSRSHDDLAGEKETQRRKDAEAQKDKILRIFAPLRPCVFAFLSRLLCTPRPC